MDFFLDSDDDHSVNGKSKNKNKKNDKDGTDDFQCENCGGNDSYMDTNTGGLCCTECFTQSQTTVAASQMDMDMDETLGLMARTRQGAAIGRYRRKTGLSRIQRKPLADYDRSTRLPQVQECIRGIQRVLKECSPIISALAGADDKEAVFSTCKTIWNTYLQSWHDGAEYYGAIYPEIRFSFRDCFLENIIQQKVIKTLSYKAADHVKQVLAEEKEQGRENIETTTTSTPQPKEKSKSDTIPRDDIRRRRHDIEKILADASDSDNYEEIEDDNESTKSKPKLLNLFQDAQVDNASQTVDFDDENDDEDMARDQLIAARTQRMAGNRIKIMLHLHNKSRPCGRKEAALALRPSMTVVAAILWMAVSPLGVTAGHICDWVSNGSLPLINAFSLLSPRERVTLKSVDSFFTLRDRTNVKALTKAIVSLQVICDYRPPSIIRRSSAKNQIQENGAFIQTVKQQAGVVLKSKDRASARIATIFRQQGTIKAFVPGQLLTPTSVPLLAARFVADMKLSQTVLNFTLALMGVPFAKKTHKKVRGMPKHWIPPALKRARPEKLQDPAHVLGVIVIACKLTPDWYTQDYQRPLSSAVNSSTTNGNDQTTQSASIKLDDDNDFAVFGKNKEEAKRYAQLKKIMQARSRFVPWSEDQFRCLGNGPIMEGYLDFLEEQLVSDTSEAVLPDFMAALDAGAALPTQDSMAVLDATAAEQLTTEDPSQRPQVRPCPTLWAPFRPHKVPKAPKRNSCEVFKTTNMETVPPPSQNFGMLIEYMAYRTCVQPSKIESFALELDDEIQKRFCIQDNVEMHPIALYRWIGDPRSTQVHETASSQATAMTELTRERLLKLIRTRSNTEKTKKPACLRVELKTDDEGDLVASETTAPSKRKPQSRKADPRKVQKLPSRSAAKRKSSPENESAEDTKQTLVQTLSPVMDNPQIDTAGTQLQLESETNAESSMLEIQSPSLPERVVQGFIERGEVEWI